MKNGMIVNMMVCWFIAISGLFTAYGIYRSDRESLLKRSYAAFWLLLFFLWFFTGWRNLFTFLDYVDIDRTFYYIDTFFAYLHVVPLAFYLIYQSYYKVKPASIFGGFIFVIGTVYLFLCIKEGAMSGPVTYWGRDWYQSKPVESIFKFGIFLPVVFVLVVKLIFQIERLLKKDYKVLNLFISNIAIFLYCVIGFLDVKGILMDWKLVIARIGIMGCCLLGYLSISFEEEAEEDYFR